MGLVDIGVLFESVCGEYQMVCLAGSFGNVAGSLVNVRGVS
jgi:hypothetical protein